MNELVLSNNSMQLKILATVGNNALLCRLNDNSYVVVNGLHVHNDFTCEWDFAYGYVSTYDSAYKLFMDKVVKPFAEYEDVLLSRV